MEDELTLGGNIQLIGFSDIDGGTMLILKKIVGNYARKFSDNVPKFESLTVHLKTVHEREKSEKSEIQVKVMVGGKPYNSEVTDRNFFFALDKSLKKVEAEIMD